MTVTVSKPSYLCSPVDEQGQDPSAPSHVDHLVCYSVKQTGGAKFAKITHVFVNNDFDSETLDLKKPSSLCLPTIVFP